MQWWRDWKPHKWLDVQFALEQFSGAEGNKDGILFIYYSFNNEKKVTVMLTLYKFRLNTNTVQVAYCRLVMLRTISVVVMQYALFHASLFSTYMRSLMKSPSWYRC